MSDHVFIVGCGDIGVRVARLWLARGTVVTALARSPASQRRLDALGVRTVAGDLDAPSTLDGLPWAGATVYIFAPPADQGADDPRMVALVRAFRTNPPVRVIYLSTSGVYGNRGGAWVRESDPPHPETDRARRRLDAENSLRNWGRDNNVPVIVLRVGGIYGPGRLPLERIRKGLPVLREEESLYTNRVHSDDLATVCVAAAEHGGADAIYNVSDGQPGTMTQYFNAVADRLGLPRPPAISLDEARQVMSPGMLSYLTESRRLDNTRMREDLGVELRYPDLARGLTQAVAEEPAD